MEQNQNVQPVVEIDHVSKRFAKVLANHDVSITLNKGEVVALLGENGAGKSTIMNILYGIYHMTSGEIRIDGVKQNITTPRDAMALGISMIQQHFPLSEHILLQKTSSSAMSKARSIMQRRRRRSRNCPTAISSVSARRQKSETFRSACSRR